MHGLSTSMLLLLAFHIYAKCGEDTAKRGGWGPIDCFDFFLIYFILLLINNHGNYIVDHGKSWKNHGIVLLNFCGNPDPCYL